MTKAVRIENADTSDYKVAVFIEDLIGDVWVRQPGHVILDFPTSLSTQYIYGTRRLVIEEL